MADRDRDTAVSRIANMEWEEFEKLLLQAPRTRGAARAAGAGDRDAAALEAYLGEDYQDLRTLAEGAARSRDAHRGPVGNVVFLPGIMGSTLDTHHGPSGDDDNIWLNFPRLVMGRVARLRLGPDGESEADPAFSVRASGLDKKTYARAILTLSQRWNVRPFAFDWRKNLDVASHRLADVITKHFPGQPVHLVAHSMGGLVCRNFIRLHPDVWNGMRGANGAGGRLVMLGTPNYGSFTIPQVLTGLEKMLRLLAQADLRHDLTQVLSITNTFLGSYQMLPAPSKLPPASRAIYRRATWGRFSVSERHLDAAARFHEALEQGQTIDPQRMTYVAGHSRETVAGLRVVAAGEFDYTSTLLGDGRVPHTLGLLEGVGTYYVEETHGDLARNAQVLAAVDELLERGGTGVLPQDLPAGLAVRSAVARAAERAGVTPRPAVPGTPAPATSFPGGLPASLAEDGGSALYWRRAVGELELARDLKRTAKRVEADKADEQEVVEAEESLRRAILGRDNVAEPMSRARRTRPQAEAVDRRVPLLVQILHENVVRAPDPLVVVGLYKGVRPAHGAGDVDQALGRAISYIQERGMFGAELGEVFLIPTGTNPVAGETIGPQFVMLAGLGQPGEFGRDDLRYLMVNVTHAALLLGFTEFSTVLLGAGRGNMPRQQAVRGILEGVCDALSRAPLTGRERRAPGALPSLTLTFVETDYRGVEEIHEALTEIREGFAIPNLDLSGGDRPERNNAVSRAFKRAAAGVGIEFCERQEEGGVRMTIQREGDVFTFSALTENAVIPVRQVPVQEFFFSGAADKLMKSMARADQEKYGQLLNTYLVPEDFQKLLDRDKSLTLVLDRSTAAFPWEMAAIKSPRGLAFFGPDMRLARQFRTALSTAPPLPGADDRRLRALVIADPAPEPHLQLPGARREGREVVRTLHRLRANEFAGKAGVNIEVVDRIGPSDCDPVEILALILGEEWDIIHFAGHGFFDERQPDRGGWVFGANVTLSAREIFRTRRVPRLVFANACYSAVVNGDAEAGAMNRQLAGLVEAFFDRGVANYIGTGWPVSDAAAVPFAKRFYAELLSGRNIGTSLAAARGTILDRGPSWGAYQHYGQPNTCFVPPPKPGAPAIDPDDEGEEGEYDPDGDGGEDGGGGAGPAAGSGAGAGSADAAAGKRKPGRRGAARKTTPAGKGRRKKA